MIILLDNVRSIFNVGAIFRTADSVGAEQLILSGYTPAPPLEKLHKTALGAVDYVTWEKLDNEKTLEYLKQASENGIKVIAIEQNSTSICYTDKENEMTWDNTIYVFGNEISGVSKDILNLSDLILEIPMYGEKNSLNVSVTVGIIVYKAREKCPSKIL